MFSSLALTASANARPRKPPGAKPSGASLKYEWKFDNNYLETVASKTATQNGNSLSFVNTKSAYGVNHYSLAIVGGQISSGVTLPSFTVPTSGFTISMWISVTSTYVWSRLFDFGVSGGGPPCFGVGFSTTTGMLSYFCYNPTGTSGSDVGLWPLDNKWHHFCMTVGSPDGTGNASWTFYKDGTVFGSSVSSAYPADVSRTSFLVTQSNWNPKTAAFADTPFSGNLNQLRIYTGALTSTEVAALKALCPSPNPVPT